MFRYVVLIAVACSTASNAAAILLPAVQVSVGLADDPTNVELNFTHIGDGVFQADAARLSTDLFVVSIDDLKIKADPFVSAGFSVTNNAAVTQTFVVSVILPIFPAVAPFSLMGGSVGVTMTDANSNGLASLTDAGQGIFVGQIDGVDVLDLLDDPYTLSVLFAGQTVVDSDVAGLPGPTIPGPPAFATIGIVHKFNLTPGDVVGMTSFFIIEPIPEFGSFGLMIAGLAVAGVAVRRYRRRAAV